MTFAFRKHWRLLSLGFLVSLLLHILLLSLAQDRPATHAEKVPVKLLIKEKKKKTAEEDKASKQIIEAPQPPTEPPDEATKLGPQDHKAIRPQKLRPQASLPGAPASAIQNGPIHIQRPPPNKNGKIRIPSEEKQGYAKLLPTEGDVLNLAHNDYIPDKNLATGTILDVSTTDFRFISYFSAVRKLVEMAFTDIGPTLRRSPYVQGRLQEVGKASFQGESKVQLKVERSGLLTEAKIVSSSGDKDIDAFWQKILNVAAPYPPLPKAYPGDQLEFTYTLYYDIVIQGDERMRRFVY